LERLLTALKVFVVVGGLLIVAGAVTLAVLLAGRGAEPVRGEQTVAVPAGMRVIQVVPDGRRLLLLLEADDGAQAIAVIEGGRRTGLMSIEPDAPVAR
jgi:hypothetical protein